MLQFIVVHDSDVVHDVYAADCEDELLEALMESKWWDDITSRFEDLDVSTENMTVSRIVGLLYHDGDSEVGYTLK